jgi:hypothetical protein
MAKNTGVSEFTGKIGGLVFYNSPYGILVRGKGNLDKKRVRKDPAFEGSRKASTEFSRASKGGRLLRMMVKRYLPMVAEHSTNYRLNSVLGAAIRGEKVNGPGQRLPGKADLNGLVGFEWNAKHGLDSLFGGNMKFEIDRGAGVLRVRVPAVKLKKDITAPGGATHMQLVAVGMAPDFEKDTCEGAVAEGAMWKLSDASGGAQVLECLLKPGLAVPLILGVGVRVFQELHGVMYDLRQGDAFRVCAVENAVGV